MAEETTANNGLGRYHFLLRRLHSLSGIVPVGVFLVFHLLINATVLGGPQPYQLQVGRIHSLEPFLLPMEIVGIFIPILFHGILGVVIILQGAPNPVAYPYGANWRYALQRWTGYVAFAYIAYHVWQTHKLFAGLGGGRFEHDAAYTTTAQIIQSAPWVAPIYAVGVVATVFHFANGLWTALITWGITIGPNAQRKAGWACAAIGVLLTAAGLGSLRTLRAAEWEPQAAPAMHAEAPEGDER